MTQTSVAKLWKAMKIYTARNSPYILVGMGIAGMATTTVLAVQATPEALRLIDAYKKETNKSKLTIWETVKVAWKCYIPSAIVGGASTGCVIGGTHISGKRTAALAAAYGLSETVLKEYKDKVVETIGEQKEEQIQESIATDQLNRKIVSNNIVFPAGTGNTWVYDPLMDRLFESTRKTIEDAELVINRRLRDEMFVPLNDFYYELGLKPMEDVGNKLGWNIDKGYLDVSFSSQLAPDGATPCLVINYKVVPEYNYF